MQIYLIGPAGLGKNIIALHLADRLGIRHLNYRSLVLDAVERGDKIATNLQRKRLSSENFPAALAFKILDRYIAENDVTDFVLEGYPKTTLEAKLLAHHAIKDADRRAFIIKADQDWLISNLTSRLVCPKCSYVLYDAKPDSLVEIKCLNCNVGLVKRHDDNELGILTRINRYQSGAKNIAAIMKTFTNVIEIEQTNSVALVINTILAQILAPSSNLDAEKSSRLLIEHLGLNLADPNIIGTPLRLVNALKELMRGNTQESFQRMTADLKRVFPTRYDGMIVLDPISCVSLCSHHLLPVQYEVVFGYFPSGRSLGFSKIMKVISTLAAKPTLQEDFTEEIVEIFERSLHPKGVAVIVRGVHGCISLRGEHSSHTNTTTSYKGVFLADINSKNEFLSLLNYRNARD